MAPRLTNWWNRQSRWERVIWVLVGFLLVAAGTVKPLGRVLTPSLSVDAAWYRHGVKEPDPWGNEWAGKTAEVDRAGGFMILGGSENQKPMDPYSLGPNGLEETAGYEFPRFSRQPGGDDRFPELRRDQLDPIVWLLAWPEIAVSVAYVLTWFAMTRILIGRRARRLGPELLRGLWIASLPTIAVVGAMEWGWLKGLASWGGSSVQLTPPQLAIPGTVALLCFLLALWWRLTRPLESEESRG